MSRATQRFRQRKLSTKQNLVVLHESDIDDTINDDAQNIPRVETGVEKAEETEHHLQQIITAQATGFGGKVASLDIPTPETRSSSLRYDTLYPPIFQQPVSNIRFSSTVEDCIGVPYCMSTEDDIFLKKLNSKKSKNQCSEDQFEEIMNFFEETAALKQPYASVDNPPVLPYEQFEQSFDDESMPPVNRTFAKDIYEHWKSERERRSNTPIMPTLKTLNIEKNVEMDDNDPYVCFRRREVRLTRKTRGRDAQVAEKLKNLRHELERARELLHRVRQREVLQGQQISIDRKVFEQRHNVKELKRKLGIKGDDEDLINQKQPVQKPTKPKLDPASVPRGIPGVGLKQQLTRADGRPADSDLPLLEEEMAKQQESMQKFIDSHVAKHKEWNKGYQDATWRPITPPLETASKSSFIAAAPKYESQSLLPTPPPSVDFGETGEQPNGSGLSSRAEDNGIIKIEHVATLDELPDTEPTFYRRRVGRGGRLLIDRREAGTQRKRKFADISHNTVSGRDRWQFDEESDEEENMIEINPFEPWRMRIRIALQSGSATREQQQQAAQQAAIDAARLRKSVSDPNAASQLPPALKQHPSLQKSGSLVNGTA